MIDQSEQNEQSKRYNSYIRWADFRREQFSKVNNLILTLSVASLGFAVSLFTDDTFGSVFYSSCLYWFSLSLFAVSIGLGILCAITRLLDFRGTSRIAKYEYKRINPEEVVCLRSCTKMLGEISWFFLWCQIILFAAGVAVFMLVISTIDIFKQ